jgi:hypothetical protein
MVWRIIALAGAFALLLTAGCTALRQSAAMDTERSLAAAGFQMKLADTEKKLAHVESLPQRKLTRVPFQGGLRYVYADAQFCRCLYAGTEKAYDRYQKLRIQQEVAEEESEASMDWGGWGAWGPWY